MTAPQAEFGERGVHRLGERIGGGAAPTRELRRKFGKPLGRPRPLRLETGDLVVRSLDPFQLAVGLLARPHHVRERVAVLAPEPVQQILSLPDLVQTAGIVLDRVAVGGEPEAEFLDAPQRRFVQVAERARGRIEGEERVEPISEFPELVHDGALRLVQAVVEQAG